MHKHRIVKRPGPLLHQQRLHSARQRRCNTAMQRWESGIAYYEALQKAMFAPVSLAALAAVDAYKAQEKRIGTAGGEVIWNFSGPLDAPPSQPSSLCPRPVTVTALPYDRVVIKVGDAELQLTTEEAARLFSIGRDTSGEQQA